MEVNVAVGGNLFPGESIYRLLVWDHGSVRELEFLVCCPIEDVDETALVNEDFLDGIIFYLNGDDHMVILLVIKAMKIVIREGYGGHATSMIRMGDVVDGLIWRRCLFMDEVDSPLAKPLEIVLIVLRRGGSVRVTSV